MKLIVGLGNPGPRYAGTRHNVGFAVVDILAKRWSIDLSREKFHAWFGECRIGGERVSLLRPTTFMNRSGQAVLAAGRFYKTEPEDLLVISDDMALPLGQIRIRKQGSAGSHNGLQNVIDRIGFSTFCRIRIGIDAAIGEPTAYVLSRLSQDESVVMEPAMVQAADAAECWLAHGPDTAMNRFNRKVNED